MDVYGNAPLSRIFADEVVKDAEYQGKKVTLNQPFRTPSESKKFAVYVENEEGNVIIVRFGDPDMEIKRDDPESREAFRARHNCEEAKDPTTPKYWSCKFWSSKSVSELLDMREMGAKDKSVSFDFSVSPDGFLKSRAVIARTGVQYYRPEELGIDSPKQLIGVLRPVEEVTSPETLESFINNPVTDDHPNELVTIDNYNIYAKGSVASNEVVELEGGEYGIMTDLIATSRDLIEKIQSGKTELSAGYTHGLVEESGEYKGESYDFKQVAIRGNHVAVVEQGRCGSACKLSKDSCDTIGKINQQKGDTLKLKIKDKEYEVPKEVADAFGEMEKKLNSKAEDAEEEEEEKKSSSDSIAAVYAQRDTALAEVAKLKSSMDSLVAERVDLLRVANDCGLVGLESKSSIEIKKAIVASIGLDSTGKTEAYLDAVIDVHRNQVKAGSASFDSFKNSEPEKVTTTDRLSKIGEETYRGGK